MGTSPPTATGNGVGTAVAQGLLLMIGMGVALRGLDGSIALRACAVFGAIMTLVIRALPSRHPFGQFGAANRVTAFRAALVSLLAGLIGTPHVPALAWAAVAMAVLATALDGVDGWLARRTGLSSDLGARFDLETDALLILVLAILTWQAEKAGVWVLVAGLLRYLFVASGWVAPWMRRALPPSRRRQTACVLQVAALTVVLLPPVQPRLATWLAAGSLAILSYSFLVDTTWLWRQRGENRSVKSLAAEPNRR